MNKKDLVTGRLWFRDMSDPLDERLVRSDYADTQGRRLFIVVGVIAVPENITLEGECIYPVMGKSSYAGLGMDITVSLQEGDTIDSKGNTANWLLTQPIWAV